MCLEVVKGSVNNGSGETNVQGEERHLMSGFMENAITGIDATRRNLENGIMFLYCST